MLQSLLKRPREVPLPLTPLAVLRSLIQVQDLQALLWAWSLVILLFLIASWSNPSDSSFRPYLTDLIFRERLRFLHESSDDDSLLTEGGQGASKDVNVLSSGSQSSNKSLRNLPFSTPPFAMTIGSKLSLSVRTPPYTRKDFRLFSVVTISHSTPLHLGGGSSDTQPPSRSRGSAEPKAASDAIADYTSIFIGAFGRWWVGAYGLSLHRPPGLSGEREEPKSCEKHKVEEKREESPEWGVTEARAPESEYETLDSAPSRETDTPKEPIAGPSDELRSKALTPEVPPSRSSSPKTVNGSSAKEAVSIDYAELAASLAESQSVVADLCEQLKQLKANSSKAHDSLQNDLEELRSHKREEDRVRLDTKAKTKALDESRRHVDGNKREAERRLKAATAIRTSKETSIATKKEEIEALKRRRAGHKDKIQASASNKVKRIEDLQARTIAAQERLKVLEHELVGLQTDVTSAEETLSRERDNLQLAYDGGFRDEYLRAGDFSMGFQGLTNLDTSLLGPGADPDQLYAYHDGLEGFAGAGEPQAHSHSSPLGYEPFASAFDPTQPAIPQELTESIDDASIQKRPRGLGANVLRNAFRKAIGSGTLAAPPFDGKDVDGNLQSVSDFEAMKQAFQPNLASEEEGRRSWSAFDIWQSDMRDARHRLLRANGAYNSSADSLPQFTNSSMLVPLDRSNSAGHLEAKEDAPSSEAEQMRNLTKVKRAFRWPFRPSQAPGEVV